MRYISFRFIFSLMGLFKTYQQTDIRVHREVTIPIIMPFNYLKISCYFRQQRVNGMRNSKITYTPSELGLEIIIISKWFEIDLNKIMCPKSKIWLIEMCQNSNFSAYLYNKLFLGELTQDLSHDLTNALEGLYNREDSYNPSYIQIFSRLPYLD